MVVPVASSGRRPLGLCSDTPSPLSKSAPFHLIQLSLIHLRGSLPYLRWGERNNQELSSGGPRS